MATQSDVRGWAAGLDEVLGRIAPRFVRAEPRRRAAACLRGLLASERKNGWQPREASEREMTSYVRRSFTKSGQEPLCEGARALLPT